MTELTPSYLDLNFDTIKADLKEKMSESAVFQDYNTDASNITILIELMAYLGELTGYYLNKIAKNVYVDTADLRENIIRLGYLVGYYPKGPLSSRTTLTVTIPSAGTYPSYGCNIGDTIRANAWTEVYTNNNATYDGESIYFTITNDVFETIDSFPVILSVPISQGRVKQYTYHGRDLLDNTLYLPTLAFGYDDNQDDNYPSVELSVNGTLWNRVENFYEDLSGLNDDDNIYVLRSNKYGQYIVRFSDARNIPGLNDEISITLIETLGANGNVGSNTIVNVSSSNFINVTPSAGLEFNLGTSWYNITNTNASTGGVDAETNDEIKDGIESMTNAQYRCVTRNDYVTYLENHSLVKTANAWGEKEISPSGNILDYNKVYLSLVQETWNGNLNYTTNEDGIVIAGSYTTSFMETIAEYLEPRKMLCAYEVFLVPDFIYFRFNMGIRIKRNYRFANVREDIKSKLNYYFSLDEREFGETISFMEIINYLLDSSKTSSTNTFSNVKGIYNINIRDIDFYDPITGDWSNPYSNGSMHYPQYSEYTSAITQYWEENSLKTILLDFNQYPMLSLVNCNFFEET